MKPFSLHLCCTWSHGDGESMGVSGDGERAVIDGVKRGKRARPQDELRKEAYRDFP